MIPALSTIIGVYVVLRSVEIICKPESAFTTHTARGLVILLAVITILVAIAQTIAITVAGENAPGISTMPGLPRQ